MPEEKISRLSDGVASFIRLEKQHQELLWLSGEVRLAACDAEEHRFQTHIRDLLRGVRAHFAEEEHVLHLWLDLDLLKGHAQEHRDLLTILQDSIEAAQRTALSWGVRVKVTEVIEHLLLREITEDDPHVLDLARKVVNPGR